MSADCLLVLPKRKNRLVEAYFPNLRAYVNCSESLPSLYEVISPIKKSIKSQKLKYISNIEMYHKLTQSLMQFNSISAF